MRRLVRPAAFTLASVAAVAVFVLTARLSAEPLTWKDLGGWLDRVEPVDAFAELARWLGLGLAVYVALVSAAALLAEVAGLVRMPRLQRGLRRLVEFVALPVLRRRLLELTTVATITASSLQAAPVGADHGPTTPVSLVVESVEPIPSAPLVRGEFEGFGFPATPALEDVPVGAHMVQRRRHALGHRPRALRPRRSGAAPARRRSQSADHRSGSDLRRLADHSSRPALRLRHPRSTRRRSMARRRGQ